MLLEGTASRPPPGGPGPVTGAEIMRKLSKTHTHSDSALKIKVRVGCFQPGLDLQRAPKLWLSQV